MEKLLFRLSVSESCRWLGSSWDCLFCPAQTDYFQQSLFLLFQKKEADLVTTHELGHNFGAEHDPDSLPECAPTEDQGGKYVMYPIAVSGDHENNKVKLHNFASTHTSPT